MSGWMNGSTTFLTSGGSATTAIADSPSHTTQAPLVWDGSKWIDNPLAPNGVQDLSNPAGVYESLRMPGEGSSRLWQNGNIGALTSGVMSLVPIWLPAGAVVNSILVRSATTALATGTHWWFALYSNWTDATGANSLLLAQTADQGAAAWNTQTAQDKALTAPQTITVSDWYGIGVMVAATTVPSLRGESIGVAGFAGGDLTGQLDLARTVGAALTTTAPANLSGFANSANTFYAAVH